MKKWPVLTVTVPDDTPLEAWELFCAEVCGDDPSGYEEREPGPNGVPREAIFYFPAVEADDGDTSAAMGHAAVMTEAAGDIQGPGFSIRAEMLEDRDWTAAWREHFHLQHVSQHVYTGPPEESELPPDAPEGAVLVQMDDVRPFGAGGHATTRGALAYIEKLRGRYESILDVGTGTGVLCFAAVKLGYEYALGIDHEKAAGEAFLSNAKLNGIDDRAHFIHGSTVDEAAAGALLAGRPLPELIVCNMLSTEFDDMLRPLRRLRRPMVLSGFLLAEAESVRQRLAETGWLVEEETELVEWGAWFCVPDPNATVS